MDYYISTQGEDQGPYSLSELRSLWSAGSIASDAIYYTEGMTEWRQLIELIAPKEELHDVPCLPPPLPEQLPPPILPPPLPSPAVEGLRNPWVSNRNTLQEFEKQAKEWLSLLPTKWKSSAPCTKLILGVVVVGVFLATAAWICFYETPLPAHVTRLANGKVLPDAGYRFYEPDSKNYRVTWSPGSSHPQYPHVYAEEHEGDWKPGMGYVFIDAKISLAVRWSPGLAHPLYPHVFASTKEGQWNSEAGFRWATTNINDWRVVWSPGAKHPSSPHAFAAAQERHWVPEAGYKFSNQNPLEVEWSPGMAHPERPHVLADAAAGHWIPDAGFEWVNPGPGNDLRVTRVARSQSRNDWSDAEKTVAAVGIAILGVAALNELFGGDHSGTRDSGWFGGSSESQGSLCFLCNGNGEIVSDVEVPTTSGMRSQRRRGTCQACGGTGRR